MSRKEFFVKKSRPVAGIAGGIAMVTTIVLAGHTSAAPSDQQAIQHVTTNRKLRPGRNGAIARSPKSCSCLPGA